MIGIKTSLSKVGSAVGNLLLLLDTFTGTNGTLLPAHTPDENYSVNPWVNLKGTWAIQSNMAKCTAGSGLWYVAILNTNISDVKATLEDTGGNYYDGVALRVQDELNLWAFITDRDSDKISIFERIAGSNVQRAFAAKVIGPADDLTSIAIAKGTQLSMICEEASCQYSSSSYQSETDHGLFSYATNSMLADSLRIEAI